MAAWYAVTGLAGPFARSGDYRLILDVANGDCRWEVAEGAPPARRLVVPLLSDAVLARVLEDWLIASLDEYRRGGPDSDGQRK